MTFNLKTFIRQYLNSRPKRIFFRLLLSIFSLMALLIILISPITKYLIEKYDVRYSGREITMNWAYVNPFSGYIYFNGLKIYEAKSDSIFFSTSGLSINLAMHKLLSREYELSKVVLTRPFGVVIQNLDTLNFDDLIARFTSDEEPDTTKSSIHFSVMNVKIDQGKFQYRETSMNIDYFIKDVNIESSGIQWNSDTTFLRFSFLPGLGSGNMKGNMMINFENLNYRLDVLVKKFDLRIIEQYLKDLANYGSFRATLDADIKTIGNLRIPEEIDARGIIAINDFHFGKDRTEDYASFKKFVVGIQRLSPSRFKHLYDSMIMISPYFKYDQYDYSLDNIQTMFGSGGSNIEATKAQPAKFNLILEIADYVEQITKNFFRSEYKVNKLIIKDGDFRYNDYSLSEKFSMGVKPFNLLSDSINSNADRVNVTVNSGIKPYGNMAIGISINPRDSSDFDISYQLEKIPVSALNPYLISYTSFPLDRGSMQANGKWKVRNGKINSDNRLLIVDPRVSKRIKDQDSKWIPLKLLMYFVRENGNAIDYEIPITGDLNDPNFHWRDVVFDILMNILIKPLTTPYRTKVKKVETRIEKSLTLKWEMRQVTLTPKQEKFLEKMADFLKKNPASSISITPVEYAEKEKEHILIYEAKKKYYLAKNNLNEASFNEKDSAVVMQIAPKDSLFMKYLNEQVGTTLLFTLQDKCTKLIDPSFVENQFVKLNKGRETSFLSFFKKEEVGSQIKISQMQISIPFNGFSFFRINYMNDLPDPLMKAYKEMQELDAEPPRKVLKKIRDKTKPLAL